MAQKKKSSKKAPKAKAKKAMVHKIARQRPLPGLEDAKIAAIEKAALDYAEIRDQRQALTADESSLKKELLALMHKQGKTEYKRNGIHVSVVVESETVKVKVKAEGEISAPEPEVEVSAETAVFESEADEAEAS